MTLDPTIVVGCLGVVGTISATLITSWRGKKERASAARQRDAEADNLVAKAAAAVQDAYQEIIADLRAQVAASSEEAISCRNSARQAQRNAAESEHLAWVASQQVAAMARFLQELRPLIAAHVPGADPILERIDRLTARM